MTREHYRLFYADELENDEEIKEANPFLKIDIVRGQTRGVSKGFFSSLFSTDMDDESGQVDTRKTVGYFKGTVKVFEN